jgi:hypothetical protein
MFKIPTLILSMMGLLPTIVNLQEKLTACEKLTESQRDDLSALRDDLRTRDKKIRALQSHIDQLTPDTLDSDDELLLMLMAHHDDDMVDVDDLSEKSGMGRQKARLLVDQMVAKSYLGCCENMRSFYYLTHKARLFLDGKGLIK